MVCLQLQGLGLARPASPAIDDWEIDITQLQIDAKVASGAFSNLYRGSYCGQEVAVKILKDVQDDTSQYQEFLQVSREADLSMADHESVMGMGVVMCLWFSS